MITVQEAKQLMINGKPIIYAGNRYSTEYDKVQSLIYEYSNGKFIPSVTLLDKNKNSVITVSLDQVEPKEKPKAKVEKQEKLSPKKAAIEKAKAIAREYFNNEGTEEDLVSYARLQGLILALKEAEKQYDNERVKKRKQRLKRRKENE